MKEAIRWVKENYPHITKPSEQIKLMIAYTAGVERGLALANETHAFPDYMNKAIAEGVENERK